MNRDEETPILTFIVSVSLLFVHMIVQPFTDEFMVIQMKKCRYHFQTCATKGTGKTKTLLWKEKGKCTLCSTGCFVPHYFMFCSACVLFTLGNEALWLLKVIDPGHQSHLLLVPYIPRTEAHISGPGC